MKIRVADITEKKKCFEETEDFTFYPALASIQSAAECKFTAPVKTSLSVVKEYDHLRVEGVVSSSVLLNCSRCLVEYELEISSKFTAFYIKSGTSAPEDEIELGEEELLSVFYSGEEIDFSNEIAEQVLLEIPYKPLCSENCKGLCVKCGTDLNENVCNCSTGVDSIAFSPLKGLSVKS